MVRSFVSKSCTSLGSSITSAMNLLRFRSGNDLSSGLPAKDCSSKLAAIVDTVTAGNSRSRYSDLQGSGRLCQLCCAERVCVRHRATRSVLCIQQGAVLCRAKPLRVLGWDQGTHARGSDTATVQHLDLRTCTWTVHLHITDASITIASRFASLTQGILAHSKVQGLPWSTNSSAECRAVAWP